MKILWSPQARKDLNAIVARIAGDKPSAALKWTRAVHGKVSRLGRFPNSGRIVPELGRADIREIIIGSYRVIYKVGSFLSILTVFHGTKDWKGDKTSL